MTPRNIITETTAEAYMANALCPKIEAIEEDIEQTKLDQKSTPSTMITFTESITQSFEDMKKTKAAGTPDRPTPRVPLSSRQPISARTGQYA